MDKQSINTTPQSPLKLKVLASPTTPSTKPRRRRIRSELDRLLSDEGTRNLLKNLKKNPNKKQKNHVFRSRVALNNSRVFRNGIRGRKINRGKVNPGGSPANSRGASPSKDQHVIDFNYVGVTRRSSVAFVTVLNKMDDGGGGGGGDVDSKRLVGIDGGWGLKVIQSIDCAFKTLEQDPSISVVVLQSSHSRYFCNGLDLSELVLESKKQQPSNNSNSSPSSSSTLSSLIKAIKSLITTLNSVRKLIVASVSGDCVGLGVMLLPLFDLVYANDKSAFVLRYNALGQSAEGIGLMQNLLRGGGAGPSKLVSLLYLNTPLTATEGVQAGLVSEILWPARYQENLAMRLSALTQNSSLTRTKATLKSYRRNFKLTDLWTEFTAIEQQWCSEPFQDNLRTYFSTSSNTNGSSCDLDNNESRF